MGIASLYPSYGIRIGLSPSEIVLANGEEIDAVIVFVNETEAFFTCFIKKARLKLS